jgi:hypothetical protein
MEEENYCLLNVSNLNGRGGGQLLQSNPTLIDSEASLSKPDIHLLEIA